MGLGRGLVVVLTGKSTSDPLCHFPSAIFIFIFIFNWTTDYYYSVRPTLSTSSHSLLIHPPRTCSPVDRLSFPIPTSRHTPPGTTHIPFSRAHMSSVLPMLLAKWRANTWVPPPPRISIVPAGLQDPLHAWPPPPTPNISATVPTSGRL